MPDVKNQRGSRETFFELFSLKSVSLRFPKLLPEKYNQYYLRTAALQYGPPLLWSWAG